MREFELLQHVYQANASLSERVLIPPGDDMALLQLAGRKLLVAVDQLIAGRHVNLATTPVALVGRKAITRSLSDIAAMAGKPIASLAAVVMPPDFGSERATELFDAMRATAEAYDCPLVGGDISIHSDPAHPLTCSVTVLAEPTGSYAITRSGACVGDGIYVTGTLGGSLKPDGTGRHLTFEPRIPQAIELASQLGPNLHAMIDISDGLGRDASHIADASKVTLQLDASLIPCLSGMNWREAASAGEDYELLFTATGDVAGEILGLKITRIGRVVEGAQIRRGSSGGGGGGAIERVIIHDGDTILDASQLGWQHES